VKEMLLISLKLNFTPNNSGYYGLRGIVSYIFQLKTRPQLPSLKNTLAQNIILKSDRRKILPNYSNKNLQLIPRQK